MSTETHRALAIRWMEQNWNDRREAVIDEIMSPQCTGRMEGGDITGPADWKAARQLLLAAFPDMRIVVDQTVAEGDTVVLRWHVEGTHDGDGLGLTRTGRKFQAVGSTWMRFEAGKLVWGYDTWNMGALMAQLSAPA